MILGIDYGLAKIGLALSEGELAEPLMVVKNRPGVVKKIARLCQRFAVQKIVLGISEGKSARLIRDFGRSLAQTTCLPVVYQDETLTTIEAIDKMIQVGKKRKYRQEKEDAFVAALILQNYLDKKEMRKIRG